MERTRSKERRTLRLTSTEKTKFKKWVKSLGTDEDAAIELCLHKNTIFNIRKKGQGSPETIKKIRAAIAS